jgi:hypothetical protein
VLAEEEVAVVEGRGLDGDDEVVRARIRSWDILEGEAIIWKLERVNGMEMGWCSRVVNLSRLALDLLDCDSFWHREI